MSSLSKNSPVRDTVQRRSRRAAWPPVLAAVCAALAAGAARAQEKSPYYIGGSQSLTADSNVRKVPEGGGGLYSSTALLGGVDQRIGRQRVYGNANLAYNKYFNETSLDNTSYGVLAGLDWATVGSLSGNVNAGARRSLASLYGNDFQNNGNANANGNRNLATTTDFSASIAWGESGPISLFANYGHGQTRFSAPESLNSESTTDSASAGAFYRLGPDIRLGAAYRATRVYIPFGVLRSNAAVGSTNPADFNDSTTNGRNLDLLFSWATTPRTGLDGRLSYTRQTNSQIGARDFSGLTGAISGRYMPTAKLAFNASIGRDVGSQLQSFTYSFGSPSGGIVPFGSINGVGENRTTTDTFTLGAVYEATAKINVKANLAFRHAKIASLVTVSGNSVNQDGSENYRVASLGADWAIARAWSLGCLVSHETRTVSGPFNNGYSANIASCTVQITLR